MGVPFSPDEAARQAALHQLALLDTPSEARFDRLTRLAQAIFRVPMVLISLVDTDRQWFKSCIGLTTTETSREVSFCAHAILHPQRPLVVLDAQADPRFAQNPLVTGAPFIRFYAGQPLRDPSGQPVGTLCVLDTVPYEHFTTAQQQVLADLAALVEQEFAATTLQQATAAQQRAEAERAASDARVTDLAQNVPGMVYQFALHPDGSATFPFANAGAQEIFEVDPAALVADASLAIARIVPEDQASFHQSVADSAATLQLWQWQGRIRMSDGREKWIEGRSRPVAQPNGTVLWSGVVQDITPLKHAEAEQARFMALTDAVPEFIAMVDLDSRPIYINPAGRALIGLSQDAPLDALRMTMFHPPWTYAQVEQGIATAVEHGHWTGETALLTGDGQEVAIWQYILCHRDSSGQPTYFSTIAQDLTAQHQAEATQRALQEEIIQVQATTLAALSTPLITVTRDTVLMPLIGVIDAQRAQRILETVLAGVTTQHARIAIVDLTGVPLIDTPVAAVLIQATQAVRLLGAEVIVTGIRPEIAQTLVMLGVDLRVVRTYSELQHGIAYAVRRP